MQTSLKATKNEKNMKNENVDLGYNNAHIFERN